MSERIRIFVGTPANSEDLECQAVYAWSLKKHHPQDDVDITWMMLSRDPNSFWYSNPQAKPKQGINTFGWATPFSGMRFMIPAACDFKGKAIYCDSDQMWIADVAELWNQPIPDGKVKLIHYTHIPTQPNHPHARKRLSSENKSHWYNGTDEKHPMPEITELFDRMLAEAIAAGQGPETFRVPVEFGDYGRGR